MLIKKVTQNVFVSRMRRSVTAESIATQILHINSLGDVVTSNIFGMTSELVKGFRSGGGANFGLSH